MSSIAFYNEIDPHAAAWLRELIKAGLIAPGEVDERSIEDIPPNDLRRFTQCHFFAGIGVWSYALRLAGWPDDRPVWTGSCPCQPFSPAGKGLGFADERHLWPAFHHLIRECRPAVCFGEQVDGDDGFAWLDLVQTDVEDLGYAFGPVVTPAAGYGAPHGRHRIYWVADADGQQPGGATAVDAQEAAERGTTEPSVRRGPRPLADDGSQRRDRRSRRSRSGRESPERVEAVEDTGDDCESGVVADDDGERLPQRAEPIGEPLQLRQQTPRRADAGGCGATPGVAQGDASGAGPQGRGVPATTGRRVRSCELALGTPGPVNGFWGDADWLHCRPEPKFPDGRWRPVEPGTFPLAHGTAARVVKLRGYGNGIVAQQAEAFVRAYLEVKAEEAAGRY